MMRQLDTQYGKPCKILSQTEWTSRVIYDHDANQVVHVVRNFAGRFVPIAAPATFTEVEFMGEIETFPVDGTSMEGTDGQ